MIRQTILTTCMFFLFASCTGLQTHRSTQSTIKPPTEYADSDLQQLATRHNSKLEKLSMRRIVQSDDQHLLFKPGIIYFSKKEGKTYLGVSGIYGDMFFGWKTAPYQRGSILYNQVVTLLLRDMGGIDLSPDFIDGYIIVITANVAKSEEEYRREFISRETAPFTPQTRARRGTDVYTFTLPYDPVQRFVKAQMERVDLQIHHSTAIVRNENGIEKLW